MKKHAWLISGALVVASSVATVVGGCGSDATTPAGPTGSTPDSGLPTGDDQDGSSTSTGSLPDSGTIYNPTPDASTGTPAGAGMVACGSTACNTATDACCTKVAFGDGGFNTTTTCQPKADSCTGGGSFACDEASDCAAGEVCCRNFGGASCKAGSCGFGSVQVCSGTQECTNDGGACAEHTCKIGQTEYKIMACSKPIGCQ